MSQSDPVFTEICRPANHMRLALVKAILDGAGVRYHVLNELASIGAIAAYNENELVVMAVASDADRARELIRQHG